MSARKQYCEANRAAWNEVCPKHIVARANDYPNLKRDLQQNHYYKLNSLDESVLKAIGIQGKRVAQLCCNNGLDLISVLNKGATSGVGFDICDEAILEAQSYATLSPLNCSFVRTDVYDIGPEYRDQFDYVFLNVGALMWLPELPKLFEIIQAMLAPSGHLSLVDLHPFALMSPHYQATSEGSGAQVVLFDPYFQPKPYWTSGLDYLGRTEYEGKQYCLFSHKMSDIINAITKSGLTINALEEYPIDISGQYNSAEAKNTIPLSFSLIAQKQKKPEMALQSKRAAQAPTPPESLQLAPLDWPLIKSKHPTDLLRNYLLFQQSKHIPSYGAWAHYAEHFEHCPGYARYTLFDWPPYQQLVNSFAEAYGEKKEYEYYLLDAHFGATDKLDLFKDFLGPVDILEKITLTPPNHTALRLQLILIRTPRTDAITGWSKGKKIGFIGCYPSVFRLLPFIYGTLQTTEGKKVLQHQLYACQQEIDDYTERLKARRDHILFDLVSDVLADMPIEIFLARDAKAHYAMGELRASIDNMLLQQIRNVSDFDNLCLHHEKIHHALYLLCALEPPHTYKDFLRLSDQLNQQYYPSMYHMNMCGYIYPSTMIAIMDPLIWIHQNEGLKICTVPICPSTSYYDKCKSVYHEIERPLEDYETEGPANVIITGFTTESVLAEAEGSALTKAIEHGLSHYARITVLLDLAFLLPNIVDITWQAVKAHVHTGRINFIIAENWHKYKGFGIEKCLSARLVVINNNDDYFHNMQATLDAKQNEIFDQHIEFQYVLSIISQGFAQELRIMSLLEQNRDIIFEEDVRLSKKYNKKQAFQKSSIMLSTDIAEKYILQTNIRENFTFGFPFTSYNTFFDPDGSYVSIRIPIGMEPEPILKRKIAPLFKAYYRDEFFRPHVETVFDLTPIDRQGYAPMPDRGTKAQQTHIQGKDAPLEQTISTIEHALQACELPIQTTQHTSEIASVYHATVQLKACSLLAAQGKGTQPLAAQASALGELVELISNNIFWNFRYLGPEAHQQSFVYFPHEHWENLKSNSWQQDLLTTSLRQHYSALGYFSELALTDVNAKIGQKDTCAFQYRCLNDESTILIPKNIVTDLYFCNGLGAGNSPAEARLHALSEIYERFVKLAVYQKQLCLPCLPKHFYDAFPAVTNAIQSLETAGFQVWVKDASLGGQYPVICVAVRHRKSGGCFASFGSDPHLETAIERTITEMIQGRSLKDLISAPLASSDSQRVMSPTNLHQHFELWSTAVIHKSFFEGTPDFSPKPCFYAGNNQEIFSAMLAVLNRQNKQIYLAEYEHLGFYTCRIIIPGLSESYFFSPANAKFYPAIIQPLREELLYLPKLSNSECITLRKALDSLNIPMTEPMNELLGLHADGNGFWDWASVEDVFKLLEARNKHKLVQINEGSPSCYASHYKTHTHTQKKAQNADHKFVKVCEAYGWTHRLKQPNAFNFELIEQQKIIACHRKLHRFKQKFY